VLIGMSRAVACAAALCGLLLVGCGRQSGRGGVFDSGTPQPATEAAASSVASPSPRAVSTRPPGPRAEVPLSLSVDLGTQAPQVGQTFTIALHVTNGGTRAADGVDVTTTGPWDRYTVLAVRPTGTFLRYASDWHVLSPIAIDPGETATIQLDLRSDQPSDEQLTFSVREGGFLVTR
jgi:Domain of unknown function DUF11